MRQQSKQLTVTYAGRVLVAPGDYLSEDVQTFGLSFTTQADALLGAGRKLLRSHGNAEGSHEVATAEDLPTMEAAYEKLLELSDFAESHPTGDLVVQVGETRRAWKAGLSGIEASFQGTIRSKVRLTVRWPFVLGERV